MSKRMFWRNLSIARCGQFKLGMDDIVRGIGFFAAPNAVFRLGDMLVGGKHDIMKWY